jgi:prolyl-tRNA synthetase
MKQSRLFAPTLREVPSEAEAASHQWMLRAGMIRQLASGIYTYLPLARKVLQKVEAIIREEMNRSGAQELLMPAIQPAELWMESGRWDVYGPELMRLQDRHDRGFALGPTHEEVITTLVRDHIRSYKKLPMNLYQIQTKYRDERRPRFGLLRGREFIMKDAYSFDMNEEGLNRSYNEMYEAYNRIFTRCGLVFRPVEADSGAIGGSETHEFMVLADVGENTVVYCKQCDYAANLEMAEVKTPDTTGADKPSSPQSKERVFTGEHKTVDQLAAHLNVSPRDVVKTLIFQVDSDYVAVLVRGDDEVNDVKIKNLLGAEMVELAEADKVKELTGVSIGSLGPVGLSLKIIADKAVRGAHSVVVGANEESHHFIRVSEGVDFEVSQFADIRNLKEGDPCPRCGGEMAFTRGIEVGQVFKLGTKYSEKLGARFLDEQGRERDMIMGCYGIGVSRTVAAAIEQNHDDHGIVWPVPIAPFDVHIIPINAKNEEQMQAAEALYRTFLEQGLEPLMDDRDERAGVKFNDSDLIGIPVRITVGGKIGDGIVEVKIRKTGEVMEASLVDVFHKVQAIREVL